MTTIFVPDVGGKTVTTQTPPSTQEPPRSAEMGSTITVTGVWMRAVARPVPITPTLNAMAGTAIWYIPVANMSVSDQKTAALCHVLSLVIRRSNQDAAMAE
jgi:hypothetical protein